MGECGIVNPNVTGSSPVEGANRNTAKSGYL